MPDQKAEKFQVYCQTCNMKTEAKVEGEYSDVADLPPGADPIDGPYYVIVYRLASCTGCQSPFLQTQQFYEIPGEISAMQHEAILYPVHGTFSGEGVPETVKRLHGDAVKCYAAALYEPCIIMCRKCLEAVCYELGETKGTLHHRLKSLEQKQKIDPMLLRWANSLRIIGNDAAHDLHMQVDREDATDSLRFVEAILLYIFTLTARFDEFQNRRRKSDNENLM